MERSNSPKRNQAGHRTQCPHCFKSESASTTFLPQRAYDRLANRSIPLFVGAQGESTITRLLLPQHAYTALAGHAACRLWVGSSDSFEFDGVAASYACIIIMHVQPVHTNEHPH